ncbi:unnamed protein product, partial [Candidula unifasciata]
TEDDQVQPVGDPQFQSHEQKLMEYLVGNYDSSVRPVFDSLSPVDVSLGLTLTQILDLDEKNQVLTTNVWLEAAWYDERLNWSSTDYGGLYAIRIPCERIWLPDIVLYNSVDDYTSGYMPTLAMVYNTSRVFWGPVIRFRSSCKIDITFFPFDTQVCRLKLGSWAYTGLEVNVWNSSSTMDLSNFVDNGVWQLLGVAVQRNVVFYNCCIEPFPDVTFSVQLRRRTKYYFMNIIIPCIILRYVTHVLITLMSALISFFLCLGGFLLPSESGEKITLGLSVLLTITVFMLMVADKMPQTSESISVISIYLMVVLSTSCLSVLSSVLVLSIHHQRGRPSRAPLWLRKLCFHLITPVLCLRRHHHVTEPGEIVIKTGKRDIDQRDSRFEKGMTIASIEEEFECQMMNHTAGGQVASDSLPSQDKRKGSNPVHQVYATAQHHRGSYGLHQQRPKATYIPLKPQRCCTPKRKQRVSPREHKFTYESCESNNPSVGLNEAVNAGTPTQEHEPARTDAAPAGTVVSRTYNLVIRYLISLIETRQQMEMRDEEIFQEWHDIAYVLDRLLFYAFFIITLLSTICILEMRPPPQTI